MPGTNLSMVLPSNMLTSPTIPPLLPFKSIKLVQHIIGTLLYYAIASDPIMIVAICAIASHQSKAT